jgi:hypothetical protein
MAVITMLLSGLVVTRGLMIVVWIVGMIAHRLLYVVVCHIMTMVVCFFHRETTIVAEARSKGKFPKTLSGGYYCGAWGDAWNCMLFLQWDEL